MFSTRRRISGALLAGALTAALALSGCSSGGSTAAAGNGGTQADIDAALQKDTQLTFWAWGPQYKDVVAAFGKAYPKVKVNLQNNGSNAAEYTKLQNVVKAGSGIPDIAQIEYTTLPQFAFGKSLTDLTPYGISSMKDKFSGSTWTAVNTFGGIYGLPQDDGPLALFYRKDIFDALKLTVPNTWDEYLADAKIIHAADPKKFIATDAGEAGLTNAMIWQAGGKPYTVSGTDVKVNLQDPGSQKWAGMWGKLVGQGLLDSTPTWTPEWTTGMSNGTYATWVAGAWAAGTLQNRYPKSAGQWRVAPIPQYTTGEKASGVQGGSSSAVMAASSNKLAAIGFVQWISANPTANQIWVDKAGFPTASGTLASSTWTDKSLAYFGGQKINQIFAQSVKGVVPGWSFLPYELYADSVFVDTVGQSYAKRSDLNTGLTSWQDQMVVYGNKQGFTVNK